MKKVYALLLIAHVIFVPAFAQNLESRKTIRAKNGQQLKLNNLIDEGQGSEKLRKLQYNNKQYLLIQFDRIPANADKQAMAAEGIKLFDYLPGDAFMAELPANLSPAILKKYKASGVFSIEAGDKISPKLNTPITAPDKYVAVTFFGNISRTDVMTALKEAGAKIANTKIQPDNTIFVNATPEVIKKMAALPFVSWLSLQSLKPEMLNNNNRGVHGIQALSVPTGRNLEGQGVTIGVGDNGDPSSATDFTGRLINRTGLPIQQHATHVTGTVGSAGLVNYRYRGMAPKSTLIAQNSSDILVHTPNYFSEYGMVLTNNSYNVGDIGCPGNSEYDVLSNYIDAQLLAFPQIMHVFAAGNDGAQTCAPFPQSFATIKSGFQTAKNVLTVGGLDNGTFSFNTLASRGPVEDGRLKPEISAGSASIWSNQANNAYGPMWGTSMASPTVTGAAALLYERYRQLNGGANPSGALMKTLMVNGADDMGNFGPDFTFGFGLLNARNAVEMLENNNFFVNSVANGGNVVLNINGVPAGAHQIKILLYWHDAPAAPYAPAALVNNLNMTVTEPGGAVTHNPLILNPAAGNVNDMAIEGVDNLNNIEQVIINNPPAGNFTVTITGANVPVGPQQFYVAYRVINPGVMVESPFGAEKWAPNEFQFIRWHAFGGEGNPFTIEYSVDNGINWIHIANVPSTARTYYWFIPPGISTTNARVRVTRDNVGYTDISDYAFAILAEPPNFATTNVCQGYVNVTWNAVPSATSYEVLMLRGSEMMPIASTTGTSHLLKGLWKDSVYFVSVRALIGTDRGRQAVANYVTTYGGACTMTEFDNDFSIDSLLSPVTGRSNTSTQLGAGPIRVNVSNRDNIASTGNWTMWYQVNGGTPVSQTTSASIPSLGTNTFTFSSNVDYSTPGTYVIKIWVDHIGDNQRMNDTLVRVVKHLANDPITLSPAFTEGFESAAAATYNSRARGFEGLDRADFNTNNLNGRARTFINNGIARTGNRAVTLDQKKYSTSSTTDSLVTTFNLSSYNSTHQLWLDFFYKNHGQDFPAVNNRIWIRGSDLGAWIPVFDLPTNDPTHFGVYRASPPINIKEILANAVPAQAVSSSFQVKFGQQGFTSANSVITNGNLDDGFTFDDITITNALNDVGIQALVSPNLTSVCELTTTETIEVRVKNYSNITLNNIAVSYRVNGVTVNETIPTLTAGQVYVHTFAQTANLAAFQQYTLDAWVHYPGDNYSNNDSLLNTVFHTTPMITTYPYLEGFESNNGYWYTGGIVSSWEWGAPANAIINRAANGDNAWVTGLGGNYNNSEQSYLYSPCFNLSTLARPVFSFSHIFRQEDDCECDFHWVEYSLDDITWTRLGNETGGTNWYDNALEDAWQTSRPNWHVSSYDVPVNAAKVRFRIVMSADPLLSFEGVGIDDVHVFDKAAVYTGPDITSGLVQTVSGNDWVHFTDVNGARIASIHPHGQNLGSTQVKVYFNNTGSDRYSNTQYYLDRNIVIQPSTAPGSNVSVRFYFTEPEANNLVTATGCSYCTSLTDAFLAGVTQYSNAMVEENGMLGDNATGIHTFKTPSQVYVAPYDNGYYAEFDVSNFSEFWINSGGPAQNQPLPIELSSFTAIKRNSTGLLEWVTLHESNTDRFIIEKSYDGVSYQSIGEVKAAGNSNISQHYRFTDVWLMNGRNYYRLKIVDVNGAVSYSPIRLLNVDTNETIITLYPNPVKKGVLYINSSVNCRRVDITDVSGRLIKSLSVAGTRQVIPFHQFAKGTYVVTVITDKGKKTEKIVYAN